MSCYKYIKTLIHDERWAILIRSKYPDKEEKLSTEQIEEIKDYASYMNNANYDDYSKYDDPYEQLENENRKNRSSEIYNDEECNTTTLCPKCGKQNTHCKSIQTRSADEAATNFFICLTCHNKWKNKVKRPKE
jgi:DNA-directed RNA polymerase subunit M/transcription elongation factor TFIIS